TQTSRVTMFAVGSFCCRKLTSPNPSPRSIASTLNGGCSALNVSRLGPSALNPLLAEGVEGTVGALLPPAHARVPDATNRAIHTRKLNRMKAPPDESRPRFSPAPCLASSEVLVKVQ